MNRPSSFFKVSPQFPSEKKVFPVVCMTALLIPIGGLFQSHHENYPYKHYLSDYHLDFSGCTATLGSCS